MFVHVDRRLLMLVGIGVESANLTLQLVTHRSRWGKQTQRTYGPWRTCTDYGIVYNNSYWDGVGEECVHYEDFDNPMIVFIASFLLLCNLSAALVIVLTTFVIIGTLQGPRTRQLLATFSVLQLFFCFMTSMLGTIEFTSGSWTIGNDLILLWICCFLSVIQLAIILSSIYLVKD